MDAALEHLRRLYALHGAEAQFELDDDAFALSGDGARWLRQVSVNPVRYEFTDHGLKVLGCGCAGD